MDVGNKIKKLMNEGKKKAQAIAIALEMDKAVDQAIAIALEMDKAVDKKKKKKMKASERMASLGVRG
jgi:hypothetical protein